MENPKKKKSTSREYIEALAIALLVALILRAFVVEAFKIPSGSMIPTLAVGDHIFVNKFTYGIRIPFTRKWLFQFRKPERGEVLVFIYPKDESLDYIKRVVGLPGDRIRLEENEVYINDKKVNNVPIPVKGVNQQNKQQLLLSNVNNFPDAERFKTIAYDPHWRDYKVYLERLGNHTHLKQEGPLNLLRRREWVVPDDMLFVMGDNRDNSLDSREWGFVPMANIKGKAMFIWLSLIYETDPQTGQQSFPLLNFWKSIRWDRFGDWIY